MALGDYIKETRAELKHVSWPTRRQAVAYSLLVIAISVGLAIYLGLLDALFSYGLQHLTIR